MPRVFVWRYRGHRREFCESDVLQPGNVRNDIIRLGHFGPVSASLGCVIGLSQWTLPLIRLTPPFFCPQCCLALPDFGHEVPSLLMQDKVRLI